MTDRSTHPRYEQKETMTEITVSDHVLHLRAERRSESRTEDKKGFRSEFHHGSFSRSSGAEPP